MDDKAFELLTKLYSEFTDFRKEVNTKLDNKSDKSDIARLEYEHGEKLESVLDGYKQVYEKQKEHDKRFDTLEQKIDKHDIEISVIKRDKVI